MLDGPGRIQLVNQQSAGDLQNRGVNAIQMLLRDDTLRANVRQKIYEAFSAYLVIDSTNPGTIRYKLSSTAPMSSSIERSFEQSAVDFHKAAVDINLYSDGVKAFTGILTEVMAGDPKVIVIDEPEAFLHPALAFKIGSEIAAAALGTDKRLFVSTHSPEFLMGCIQSGVPLNIVRLTYRDGVGTARLLANDKVLSLMRDPLLRSTGILAGIFYEHVVVGESDADRAFYQEINDRMVRARSGGAANCLFVNAQNKQTIYQIVHPLRELGIATAAIADIDVIKDGGQVWTRFLESGFVPTLTISSTALLRANLKSTFLATGKDMKRDGGIALLNPADRAAAQNLFAQLAEYGLFIVPGGELEGWLKHLGAAASHSPEWLIEVFEKMGADPNAAGYVQPSTGDVWDFMRAVGSWLRSPTHKGIPD